MGSLTRITQTGTVGTCNTRASNIGSKSTENGLRHSSSPSCSTSSTRSMSRSTSYSRSMSPSATSSQSASSTDPESTSEEEGSSPSYSRWDASAVMRKRKLMDARCFRAIFSGGCYTKKIKLVHDDTDQVDQEASKESVPYKSVSPSSGEVGTTTSPSCRNHGPSLSGDKDPKHELSPKARDDSCNLNDLSPSHKLDKKSDNDFHTNEHHRKNNVGNGDDLSCRIAYRDVDTLKRLLTHCDSSNTRVDEKIVNEGSHYALKNDIGTSKMVDCNSGENSSSPGIEQDGIVRSSRVSTVPILPLPLRFSELNTESTDLCNRYSRGAASLSSCGKTTQVVRIKKAVNQLSSDSELEEGEIRENPRKSRCYISEGIGIPPKGAGFQPELQSEHRCAKAEAVSEQKSSVERAIRERTRKLLAEQMLEKDEFKKIMDLEEVKLKGANEHDRERFAEHRSKQRRRLIQLQVLARNKEKETHIQWLEDASNGNLSNIFDSIPLPSSGFSPEEFMLSPNTSVSVADGSHASEQESDRTCELGKSSGMSLDQLLEKENGDSPSNTFNEIGKEVDKIGPMQSKGVRAEIEKQTQCNPQPCSQVSAECHQGAQSPSDGSSQINYSGFACQVSISEKPACDDASQEIPQPKQILASEQPRLGPSSLKAHDKAVESTKMSRCTESEGPKAAEGGGFCKDLLLSSSEPTKLALTKIMEKQPSIAPDELHSAQEPSLSGSLGASMQESIKLLSEDLKVVPEQIQSSDPTEVPIQEPTDDLPPSQDLISSSYEVRQGESGPQNLIAGPESLQVYEDDVLVSDVMGNVEPLDNYLASRLSPDKVRPEEFQNAAVSNGMESRQEATDTEKRLEMLSVVNKLSDVSKTSSPDNLACNFPSTNDGPSILHKKISTQNPEGNMLDLDLCVPTTTELAHNASSCSQPVGVSLSNHVHKEESEVSISDSLQISTLQQIQAVPSSYGNSVVSAAVDSGQLPCASQPFPVSSFEATPYDDDVIVLDSCHPASSSESMSFAAWVQSDASAPGQDSSAVAMITPSEHHQGNSGSTSRDRLSTNSAMTSNTVQPQLPSFVQASNTPHAERSGELTQAVTSQVNEQTSSDTVRAPNYHCNSYNSQGSTSGVSQPYVMTTQLPFRGILADPLANELSRILMEKDLVIKMCNDAKAKLKSEFDIEVEKVTKKYETRLQTAAAMISERNGRLDIIYEQIKRNQFLANCCRSEMAGYDPSMEIITSAQGESSGSREQSGSGLGSASGAAAVRMSSNNNPLYDTGTIFWQGQSQSTTMFPVSASISSASSSRQQFGSGFVPASSVAVPISATNNTLCDTARLSQAQLSGSGVYPVAISGSLTSSLRRNFGPGTTAAPALGTVQTSDSSSLGGRLTLPASVPSAGAVQHPFPSGVTPTTAAWVIPTAPNTNPVITRPWRQQFEPCVTSTPSGRTVPVSVSTYPGPNPAMFPPVQLQCTTPSPSAASVPLPRFPFRVNQQSSSLMPNSSIAPIGSVPPPVISNPIRSPPPHLRYMPTMPVPRSTAQ